MSEAEEHTCADAECPCEKAPVETKPWWTGLGYGNSNHGGSQ